MDGFRAEGRNEYRIAAVICGALCIAVIVMTAYGAGFDTGVLFGEMHNLVFLVASVIIGGFGVAFEIDGREEIRDLNALMRDRQAMQQQLLRAQQQAQQAARNVAVNMVRSCSERTTTEMINRGLVLLLSTILRKNPNLFLRNFNRDCRSRNLAPEVAQNNFARYLASLEKLKSYCQENDCSGEGFKTIFSLIVKSFVHPDYVASDVDFLDGFVLSALKAGLQEEASEAVSEAVEWFVGFDYSDWVCPISHEVIANPVSVVNVGCQKNHNTFFEADFLFQSLSRRPENPVNNEEIGLANIAPLAEEDLQNYQKFIGTLLSSTVLLKGLHLVGDRDVADKFVKKLREVYEISPDNLRKHLDESGLERALVDFESRAATLAGPKPPRDGFSASSGSVLDSEKKLWEESKKSK